MAVIVVIDDCGNSTHITEGVAFEYLTRPDASLHDLIIPCAACGKVLLHMFSYGVEEFDGFDEQDNICEACYNNLTAVHEGRFSHD